jgi:hypothetical protein
MTKSTGIGRGNNHNSQSNCPPIQDYEANLRKKYPDGIPPGTKTRFGWLLDDECGEPDQIAIQLAVSGDRCPDLTWKEALLAGVRLIDIAAQKHNNGATELISQRLNISLSRAKSLMSAIISNRAKGRI